MLLFFLPAYACPLYPESHNSLRKNIVHFTEEQKKKTKKGRGERRNLSEKEEKFFRRKKQEAFKYREKIINGVK